MYRVRGGCPIPVRILPREELNALAGKMARGDRDVEDAVAAGISALIWRMARRLSMQTDDSALTDDLFSEGMKGAIRRLRKFDVSKGSATTYACAAAFGYMRKALWRNRRAREAAHAAARRPSQSPAEIEEGQRSSDPSGSAMELKIDLRLALRQLPPREAEVLIERFGLSGRAPKTLGEIADCWGFSREGIRKIELRAQEKLRCILTQSHAPRRLQKNAIS